MRYIMINTTTSQLGAVLSCCVAWRSACKLQQCHTDIKGPFSKNQYTEGRHAFPSYGRPSPPPRYTSTSCVPGPCEGRWLSRLHVQAISHTDIDSISVGHVMFSSASRESRRLVVETARNVFKRSNMLRSQRRLPRHFVTQNSSYITYSTPQVSINGEFTWTPNA